MVVYGPFRNRTLPGSQTNVGVDALQNRRNYFLWVLREDFLEGLSDQYKYIKHPIAAT